MSAAEFVRARVAELEAIAQAATPGEWEFGDRYLVAGVMGQFGEGKCTYCRPGLGEPVWTGRRDINGEEMDAHVHIDPDPWMHGIVTLRDGGPEVVVPDRDLDYGMSPEDGAHITYHDPAHALATVAAYRAILELHEQWPVLLEGPTKYEQSDSYPESVTFRISQEMAWLTTKEYKTKFGTEPPTSPVIAALASIWSNHPDYDPTWAPAESSEFQVG